MSGIESRGIEALDESERAFLDAIRAGESANGYARRAGYSVPWAKWKSGRIRAKLGAATLREAVEMSEVTAEDVAALRKEIADLKAAQARLEAAKTPAARESAREDVKEAKEDLDDELRRRGLTRADLDELQVTKENARIDARLDERERVRAEDERQRAIAAGEIEEDDEDDPDGKSKPNPKPAGTFTKKRAPATKEKTPKPAHWAERPLFGKRGEDA